MVRVSWWERRVVPRLVEKALSSGDVRRERTLVCEGLSGRVLEIGFGSGMNLPHLPPSVTAVDAVEPSDLGWEMSAARRGTASLPVSRVGLDGQRVDAESSAYDAVLCTFSLCTIPDAALAARSSTSPRQRCHRPHWVGQVDHPLFGSQFHQQATPQDHHGGGSR